MSRMGSTVCFQAFEGGILLDNFGVGVEDID